MEDQVSEKMVTSFLLYWRGLRFFYKEGELKDEVEDKWLFKHLMSWKKVCVVCEMKVVALLKDSLLKYRDQSASKAYSQQS
ncbi:hypothetical protein Leryth_015451 [Lithospermum erythrorhizon]|nr:hypothetical protein Leryth_015451 [Lithospermum erythrorhizon]